ncbi:hypothetical protein SSS_10349 [Sarcoptes scabiei]|uniref:Transcription initiation factor TFIID subunit 8 n=1 Tax=Sarcoptes scabiei TaxID=52283 RepID=A0A834R5L3_SARSC|nr:hypothetical protein SSS_10349 [Sarcoptes scabiei]UXI20668.1 phosphatidylethanolamine-binding protein F40A3.3-like [Sarcoptes scabiei]
MTTKISDSLLNNSVSNQINQIPTRKKLLLSMIAATCQEAGFNSIEASVLDLLLRMFIAYLSEIGFEAKSYSEHSGRTEHLPGDVLQALIDMGCNIQSLRQYARRPNRMILPSPQVQSKQQQPKILQTGRRKPLLPYIPDYMPPFPDSHSYIATPTYKQPITDYEILREKSSQQKRDAERALTRFMARTFQSSNSYSLFSDEQLSHMFPLIGIKSTSVPYLSALLPKDKIFNADDNPFECLLQNKKQSGNAPIATNSEEQKPLNETFDQTKENEENQSNETIDNPFLMPPKIASFE